MVTTTKDCCCCKLRTGTIVIGILGVFFSMICLTGQLMVAGAREKAGNKVYLNDGEIMEKDGNEVDLNDVEITEKANLAITIGAILYGLTQLIFSGLLLYGALWEKPRFIKPWVYYSIVCLVIGDIGLAERVIQCFIIADVAIAFFALLVAIIYTLIYVYLIIVVNSYHRQLKGIDQPVMPQQQSGKIQDL